MIKNYLKIAWRSIKTDKLFTFIKVGGFAVGIAACLLIALFIKDELSYDQQYENKDRIYRVVLQGFMDGEIKKSVHFQLPFADALQSDFPEIEKAGKINMSELFGAGKRGLRLTGESQNNFEDGFVFANQNIFEILEITLVQGNTKEALLQPGNIVITKSKADKYFPEGNALGKSIVLDNNTSRPYTITGVMPDFPKKSHLQFNFLLPIEDTNMSWTNQNYFTYVLVDENASIPALEKKMFSIMENYIIPAQLAYGRDPAFIQVLKTVEYKLQPIADIHLRSDLAMGDGLKHGDIRFVWLFGAIAGFILLLACINFINLSTAKSANRAKEVGMRKTVGAYKSNLVAQFLTESVLYSLISFLLGLMLAWVLLPTFNEIAAKSILFPWEVWWFVPLMASSALFIGIIAGMYPAFYLSSFRPVNVLKGSLSVGSKSGNLRSGLVVFQFAASVILIIGTLIIYKQMNYILHKELGYDKDQVVILEGANILGNKSESFKAQLLQLPQVQAVTKSDYLPIDGAKRNGNTFKKVGEGIEDRGIPAQVWRVDYDYIKTLGVKVKEGRDFSRQIASDSINSMIINAKMAQDLGYENPIGKYINNGRDWTIVGVVQDFHFKSLKEDISALTLVVANNDLGAISVKLKSDNIGGGLAAIEAIWNKNVPNQAFAYSFLDQKFTQMHEDVQRMGKIFNSFALFAILVACLGLFALSAFMVEQRKKEISIRLVLGAPFESIYKLLTLDFLKLIVIAILIAIPIGWYMMNRWLEDFAYKVDIGWEIFLSAGMIAMAVAVATISYQSIGAALIKPLKSLRTE
ncbi:ABC transporter permease [Arenibacter sp. BSSL-BM3]|uniref:ABC transporter permease n=1 Tax=Arenibacter arenosicollis TaxID=2762274 RepID=A0ABR7QRV8_9FLAO|nr:ABC transporter permease [Arenibacter arenosicollis]MBC8769652.1 ABC transporter permease [Arenibacter arenosicollis]